LKRKRPAKERGGEGTKTPRETSFSIERTSPSLRVLMKHRQRNEADMEVQDIGPGRFRSLWRGRREKASDKTQRSRGHRDLENREKSDNKR